MSGRATRQAALVALCALCFAGTAEAQRMLLQGIANAEFWSTDAKSTLLTRNDGHAALGERLDLWGAVEFRRGLILYAEGQVDGGRGSPEGMTKASVDQLGVRWLHSEAFVVDVGRLPSAVGAFVNRRLSSRNPLIGLPDGYSLRYPDGVQLSGVRGLIDYRIAVQTLPVTNKKYVPEPTAAARPVIGVGVTPMVGLHVGLSATAGPYLNCDLDTTLLAGKSWRQYLQRVGAMDVAFSRGYFETNAELAVGSYDAPARSRMNGFTYYGEGKYTFTPRFFAAIRYERNDYPYLQPNTFGGGGWIARVTDFSNVEGGIGWRLTPTLLAKASYRADRWLVDPSLRQFMDNGRAFAMQLSYGFDVANWRRPR